MKQENKEYLYVLIAGILFTFGLVFSGFYLGAILHFIIKSW